MCIYRFFLCNLNLFLDISGREETDDFSLLRLWQKGLVARDFLFDEAEVFVVRLEEKLVSRLFNVVFKVG